MPPKHPPFKNRYARPCGVCGGTVEQGAAAQVSRSSGYEVDHDDCSKLNVPARLDAELLIRAMRERDSS